MLRGSDVTSAESKAMVETIADQATDLSNIVEDLLVGARADLGQLDMDASPFDALDLLRGVLHSPNGIALESSGARPAIAVGDPGRVRQILRNLLSNAERYGGESRHVSVVVTGGMVSIAVCDDGPPLAPDVTEHIFDRYYRGQAGSGRPGSVGIGLTISRELARMMSGDLVYRHDGQCGAASNHRCRRQRRCARRLGTGRRVRRRRASLPDDAASFPAHRQRVCRALGDRRQRWQRSRM